MSSKKVFLTENRALNSTKIATIHVNAGHLLWSRTVGYFTSAYNSQ